MTPPLKRIAFAGTPAFAARCLEALLAAQQPVVAVWTQPDRARGRGRRAQASPVKQRALAHGLPVHQPDRFTDPAAVAALADCRPDVLVVVAYGLLLPRAVLDIPRLGCVNVHASLLPRWRGAAPVERAIEAGDRTTGVSIMQMDAGLDTGPVLLTREWPIAPDDTGARLRDKLATLGGEALLEALPSWAAGTLTPRAQPEAGVCYARKLTREEARLDWSENAAVLARRVRAFNDANVCWTPLGANRVRIWEAQALDNDNTGTPAAPGEVVQCTRQGIDVQCGEGLLRLTRLQLPGGKALTAGELLNGRPDAFAPGTRLGDPHE